MRRIDLTAPPNNITVFVHGPTRSGKTHFAGSFPKPRFLSDVTERGYETLRTMDRANLFDKAVLPEVWGIETPKDMIEGIKATAADVKEKKPNAPLTLVIDSITFYANLYFDAMEQLEPTGKTDGRKLYGYLLQHLRRVMITTHDIPINIVWLALTSPPEEGQAGILIPGQSAKILPAACQHFLFCRQFNEGQTVRHEVRTKQFGPYPAGCRAPLPDPLPTPNYKALIHSLTNTQPK